MSAREWGAIVKSLLRRSAVLVAGLVAALLVGTPALAAPSAVAGEDPARHSVAKKPSRLVAKTGAYSGGDYSYYALGTLFRDGSKYAGRRVALQARVSGKWKVVDRDRTSVYGTVKWYFKPSSIRWRLRFAGDDGTYSTRSDVFRFGSGRMVPQQDAAVDPTQLVTPAP